MLFIKEGHSTRSYNGEKLGLKSNLRILLLQIREADKVRKEELSSFARYCDLEENQFDVLNVFDTPSFNPTAFRGYDALFVGGASDANVLMPNRYPFVLQAQEMMREAMSATIPTFASCFGYQLAVLALGGEIIHDGEKYEMGTIPISLTEAAAKDPVFRGVSSPFMAVSVHKQKSLSAPPNTISLAYTDLCHHAFKAKTAPFWAFQFHPEVDRQILVERLTFYKQHYTDSDGHLDQVLSTAVETPASNGLCRNFVDRVLLGKDLG